MSEDRATAKYEGYCEALRDVYDAVANDKHPLTEERLFMHLTALKGDAVGDDDNEPDDPAMQEIDNE